MKLRNSIAMPILAILVGFGMIVSAVIVSNTLTYQNVVGGNFVIDSDWNDSTKEAGVTYSLNVSYESPVGIPDGTLMFGFNCTGMNAAAVSIQYLVGEDWMPAVPVSESSGNVMYSAGVVPGGEEGTIPIQLTYNQVGTFIMTIWVEGTIA